MKALLYDIAEYFLMVLSASLIGILIFSFC